MSEQTKSQFPTEMVDIPSQGKLYPKEHPFSSGKVEMRYMTAKEEDIITSRTLIQKGIAFDRLLQSLIVEKVDLNTLLVGDKNALLIAARVLGYGKDYKISVTDPNTGIKEEIDVDLSKLNDKPVDFKKFIPNTRHFETTLPLSKRKIVAKVNDGNDENMIEADLKGLRKLAKTTGVVPEITTRLIHAIVSVDGNDKKESIRSFVNNELLAGDSSVLRDEMYDMSPDLDMSVEWEDSNGEIQDIDIPINLDFFFPNTRR